MGRKRNLLISGIVIILLLVAVVWFVKSKSVNTTSSDVDEIVQSVENALDDNFKKQSKTEVVATLVYGNGKKRKTSIIISSKLPITKLIPMR